MRPNRSKGALRSINAKLDRYGRVSGHFASSVPNKGFVCVWPIFPVLTPPTQTKGSAENTQR